MTPELGAFPLAGVVPRGYTLRLESHKEAEEEVCAPSFFPYWDEQGLERRPNGYEHLVLFQRTWVQIPATTRLLPAGCNSCFRDSNALFWLLWTLHRGHVIHTVKQSTSTWNKSLKNKNRADSWVTEWICWVENLKLGPHSWVLSVLEAPGVPSRPHAELLDWSLLYLLTSSILGSCLLLTVGFWRTLFR